MKKQIEKIDGASVLNETLATLRKKFGSEAIMTEDNAPAGINFIPTGSFVLDDILGGGLPEGRIIECYGEASSGKTTLALFIAAQFQKMGKVVAFLDHENAYSRDYAAQLGVDTGKLLVSQPDTLEESFEIIMALAATNEVSLIVVDSVSAMVPRAEFESDDPLKDTMALQARQLSKALRQMTGPLHKSKTSIIFINQTRASFQMYGPSDTTSGGKALKFFSSIRLQVKKEKADDKFKGPKETVLGNTLKIAAVKNKCAIPFKAGTIDLYFGSGIDLYADTFSMGVDLEVITKAGNSYSFLEGKLGVGEKQGVAALRESPDLYEHVRKEIFKKMK